jgi:hypothetical protein
MAEPEPSRRRTAGLAGLPVALAALAGCALPSRVAAPGSAPEAGHVASRPSAGPEGEAAEALARFATALRAGRFEAAWPLLSARWRARTTPEQLAADWRGAGLIPPEAVDRITALLASGATPTLGPAAPGQPRRCALVVGPGRAARLEEQAGGWRVDALE